MKLRRTPKIAVATERTPKYDHQALRTKIKLPKKSKRKAHPGLAQFTSAFLSEIHNRSELYKSTFFHRNIAVSCKTAFTALARVLWDASKLRGCAPLNYAYVWLNHYWRYMTANVTYRTHSVYLQDFATYLESNPEVALMLDFTESEKAEALRVIREVKDALKSQRLSRWLETYAPGFRVLPPADITEHSRFFEIVILMGRQMQQHALTYYTENHAIELLQAHLFSLKIHGNPIRLNYGNFVGVNAMYRLNHYLACRTAAAEKTLDVAEQRFNQHQAAPTSMLEYSF